MTATRRSFLEALLGLAFLPNIAEAQQAGPVPNPFRFEDVVRRARELAGSAFETVLPPLPDALQKLDFDGYRDIRFRNERSFLAETGPFRMQLFHLGFLYPQPVTVNTLRGGVATPIPYQRDLFDYGRTKLERPLPVNFGFAGFRLHYPLNAPKIFDELVSFLGASYFRFLGRGQKYGLSARGLALNVEGANGEKEEFPFFREFWIEPPTKEAERITVYALLDSASVTGAYRFILYPGSETVMDVTCHLFARHMVTSLGIAPLTSMFFVGENDRRYADDFRPEVHDSDGLLMHTGVGEWIWRPLRNPRQKRVSSFNDSNPQGFGLMQRDRIFENMQDLEAAYHLRPGYWVEPVGSWGEGRVELVEIPTLDETHDNIVAYWEPKEPFQKGQERVFAYKLSAIGDTSEMHQGGKVINSYEARPKASGSSDPGDPLRRRFLIDFAGGDLAYYQADPSEVQLVPTTSAGKISRSFIAPNPHVKGFRAAFDITLEPGQSADLRAFLRVGDKALTETWIYVWSAP
jgi:periplasmic glucans biosynthesis protein